MENDAFFVTGATGFLGTEIVSELLKSTDKKIYVLVRAKDESEAVHRLKSLWYENIGLYQNVGVRVMPIPGDFEKEDLGLDAKNLDYLKDKIFFVIHAGAEVGFQKNDDVLLNTNFYGTANVISFAKGLIQLKRFVYISTAYVSGQRTGIIAENAEVGTSFSATYEKSKAEAEALVIKSELPYMICRPGMIVGNSKTGQVKNFNTVYYMLRILLTKKIGILPISKNTKLNIVPVDYVAEAVVKITLCEDATKKIFHLTSPADSQPMVGELIDYLNGWAKEELNIQLPKITYVPLPALKMLGISHNKKTKNRNKTAVSNILTLLPYFYSQQIYDRSNTDEVVGIYNLDWHDYIDKLLTFACRKNFMRQTGQTVFEQAMIRRTSKKYPIKYYDISENGISEVTGEEANRRINRIVNALWACGIRKGDKIALTGINSVDYMTLDHAIGLLGCVSVPIYYTSPIDEIELLLQKSGAKWLFVGDRRIMNQLDLLKHPVNIVAFSDGLKVTKSGVMKWEEFLLQAKKGALPQYVSPDDLATIRYTSGTTGEPKGVMFSYKQLAFMGEVLTNLLQWRDRNRTMRYLSFLPESHVVEGILASYAPYYMLASVEYYFLNDFGALVDSLPKVRPTVFFSVPRFYEKLWDQVVSNPIGRAYLKMSDGFLQKVLSTILRRVVLKKAGLDACSQLIVGSAPISEALLLNFRKLGIEIYNAYGQTEAPLITINRFGDNIIPTIGTPLPDTEVEIMPDGELVVKGPQVALGYYGLETDTIKGGVLKTGDLGEILDNKHVILHGRKKEMIITAYGKNISTPKIEEKLKNINCVVEAVLIGENRPYCTALLWVDGDATDLKEQIEKMNSNLSHPEQVRKFKIIDTPLSIKAGELTPNLKVKRAVVEAHYVEQIEDMY